MLYAVSSIVSDMPDAVERSVQQIKEYLGNTGAFIAHAASEHPNEFVMALSAVVTAAFTVVLALKTAGLFKATADLRDSTQAMVKFAEEQSRDMKASIAAAQTTANAAKASADSLPIIEAAYVYPDILVENIAESIGAFGQATIATNRLVIEFQLKNFGKTPAIIKYFSGDLIHPNYPDQMRAIDAEGQILKKTILGAGEPTERLQTEIRDFSREEYLSVAGGRTHLNFMGHIVYSDIFGNWWRLSFDWQYGAVQGRLIPDNQPRAKIQSHDGLRP
jgi:hypothetical protein